MGSPQGHSQPQSATGRTVRFMFAGSGLMCAILVTYASIVPLNFVPLTWDESILRWRSIPWLELGVWERADWIANTLIFIPPTFLMSGYLCTFQHGRSLWAAFGCVAWTLFMVLLVLCIEFIQIWFPPRTVSWNDVFAGILGVFLGSIGWLCFGPWLARWLEGLFQNQSTTRKVSNLLFVSMLVCVFYSLYPFDVIFSSAEFEEKRIQGRLRWWTDVSTVGWLGTLQSWVLAAIRLFPFGFALGWAPFVWRVRTWGALLVLGFLAILFELIQVPIFSKHAAGNEIVAGFGGGLVGWWISRNAMRWTKVLEYPGFWLLCVATWTAVLPVAFLARSQSVVTDPQAIADRWWGMLTPPLSRYYFTSEYSALTSLAGKLAMFGVLGLCIAGYANSRDQRPHLWPVTLGFLLAGLLACLIEVLQVYLSPLIADLSDIFIYMVGYGLGVVAGFWLFREGGGYRGVSGTRSGPGGVAISIEEKR